MNDQTDTAAEQSRAAPSEDAHFIVTVIAPEIAVLRPVFASGYPSANLFIARHIDCADCLP